MRKRRQVDARPQTSARALSVVSLDFELNPGTPLPLGPTLVRDGVNFAIVSEHATEATLVIQIPYESEPIFEFPLDPVLNRTGNIWHAFLRGLDPSVEYGFRFDRFPNESPQVFRFDPDQILLDPYAKATNRDWSWGERSRERQLRSVVVSSAFDWGLDKPLRISLSDSIFYELHVRAFTQHPTSGVSRAGTFAGLTEKIPYLKDLGVTAVELLPICEFEETRTDRIDPSSGEKLLNLWGYQPVSFFSPNAAHSAVGNSRGAIAEFKSMVREFHDAGIEVILDVVFNHTGEGGSDGPTLSFRGIDNPLYYILEPRSGRYLDYTGCGNTLNCNHPIVREMVLDVLRHWVSEYHIDGFRFDLASALGRGPAGEVLPNPPLLEHIVADPCLADVKLIAEAWDSAGLYQVGQFPAYGRWAEWNGKFRDDIRRFVKGDAGMLPAIASRLTGSADLYQHSDRQPFHSVNFVTCHDGFTLSDLVSYNEKHNEANGEENRDGSSDNFSWNCGAEGATNEESVLRLREKQVRNLATLLMMSHGVPMILYGDELGRTQLGNNNAYCQDNELAWLNWDLNPTRRDLHRFFKHLIHFRRQHSVLRRDRFEPLSPDTGVKLDWHGTHLFSPDWSFDSRSIALHLSGGDAEQPEHIFLIANAYWSDLTFDLPQLDGKRWARFVDTSLSPPRDICPPGQEIPIEHSPSYTVAGRSVVVLVGE